MQLSVDLFHKLAADGVDRRGDQGRFEQSAWIKLHPPLILSCVWAVRQQELERIVFVACIQVSPRSRRGWAPDLQTPLLKGSLWRYGIGR